MNAKQARRLRNEAKLTSGGAGFRAIKHVEKKLKEDFHAAQKAPEYKKVKEVSATEEVSSMVGLLKYRERVAIKRNSRNFKSRDSQS